MENKRKLFTDWRNSLREPKKQKTYERPSGPPPVLSSALIKLQKSYYAKYSQLLLYTLEDEVAEVENRLSSWSRKKLQQEGIALFRLKGKVHSYLFKDVVIKFTTTKEEALPFHKFANGDMVILSNSEGNPLTECICDGYVLEKSKTFLNIVVNQVPNNLENTLWRVDKSANKVTYDREMDALSAMMNNQNPTPPTIFRDLILGNVKSVKDTAALPPPPRLKELYSAPFPAEFEEWKLNETQRNIIKECITKRLCLVQGPPGTGKTHTAVHLVKLLVHFVKQKQITILCTADTNVAVDNLLEGLVDCGLNAIRIGKPVKIREELRNMSVEAKLLEHPSMPRLENLRNQNDKKMNNQGKKLTPTELAKVAASLKEIERGMIDDILNNVEVICATCVGTAHDWIVDRTFPIVLIDEATQATEPATLCAFVKGAEHVIMLGDHFQLPPTVTSKRAEEGGLAESMFLRFVKSGIEPLLLDTQYRMHPIISAFPSEQFYSGKIKNGISSSDRNVPTGFAWPVADQPIAFVNVDGKEEESVYGTSKSKRNPKEAETVICIVEQIIAAGELGCKEIGVITPYSGQVKHITERLEKRGGIAKGEKFHKLSVNSVDGFQGREKDLIIFSTVRSNIQGKVGFLEDWRRLNVGITRARRGLIVIGNEQTLSADSYWNSWLQWMKQRNFCVSKEQAEQNISQHFKENGSTDATDDKTEETNENATELHNGENGNHATDLSPLTDSGTDPKSMSDN